MDAKKTFFSKTKFGNRINELQGEYLEVTGKVRGRTACERINLCDLEYRYERVQIHSLLHINLPLVGVFLSVLTRGFLIRHGFLFPELVEGMTVVVIAMMLWLSFSALRPTVAFRFRNKQQQLKLEILAERKQLAEAELFVEQISKTIATL